MALFFDGFYFQVFHVCDIIAWKELSIVGVDKNN